MYDVIIIGGGTAGLSAAIYTLRAGKSVLILESGVIGGQITSSPRIENYPGIMQISGSDFAYQLMEQATSLGAELELDSAVSIEDKGDFKIVHGEENTYEGKSIIIATGSKHRHLGIPREEEMAGRGVSYCAVCDGAFFKNKAVAVAGGGNSALQSAAFLSQYCSMVYLIHRRDTFRGEERALEALEKKENVKVLRSTVITGLEGDTVLTGLHLKHKDTNITSLLEVSGLFISVGQIPDNGAFSSLVELDETGYIVAGEDCKTGTDGVFVAGDCRTKSVRQLTTAAADGAVAALAACEYVG